MGCCSNIPYFGCQPDMNEKMKKSLEAFSGHTRKAMKLIAKKYVIIEWRQDPPVMIDDRLVREEPIIVRYAIPELNMCEFEWRIYSNEIK